MINFKSNALMKSNCLILCKLHDASRKRNFHTKTFMLRNSGSTFDENLLSLHQGLN